MNFVHAYLRSPYFNFAYFVLLSLICGLLVAFFPFNDLSVKYLLRPGFYMVLAVIFMLSFIIINWVMMISFYLDKKYDWQQKDSGRIVLQIFGGVIAPLFLIVLYQIVVFGVQLIESDTYYYIFALQLVLLSMLNERAYRVHLILRKEMLKSNLAQLENLNEELRLANGILEKRCADIESLYAAQQESKSSIERQALHYSEEIVKMKGDIVQMRYQLEDLLLLPRHASPYVLTINQQEFLFSIESILGFEICGSDGKKPLIYIVVDGGERYLTNEGSLQQLSKDRFVNFLRLDRQHLISPRSIVSYVLDDKIGGCWMQTKLKDQPIHIAKDKWSAIADRVQMILSVLDMST